MTGRRRSRARLAGLVFVLAAALAPGAGAVVDVSGPADGIAVAAFAERGDGADSELPDVASLLAGALSSRSPGRVVLPSDLRRDARGGLEPEAEDVRRWALWNRVENVIVGRTASRGRSVDVAVELRSGHSGAASAEYRVAPASRAELSRAVDELAVLILADVAGEAPAVSAVAELPPVEAPPPVSAPDAPKAEEPAAAVPASGSGPGMALLPETRRDDPISINSEELEVLSRDGGRRLVFSRNVEVLQGDVTMNADRLEAVYPQGASQPDLLFATGHVRVSQGDRRARCREATYERQSQVIVCRGNAEVLQGCDRVRGEEISFDLGAERVRVSGAASVLIRPEDGESGECVPPAGGRP